MKAFLNRRYHFSASHRLHTDALSDEANRTTFGMCNNPFGHGHNYSVTVTFSGPIDPATGMVANLVDLDSFAQEHLLTPFDVTNLNTLDLFAFLVPSTENLTVALHRIFTSFPHAQLEHIHVEETAKNSFDLSTYPQAGRT